MRRAYTRDDVQTHSDNWGPQRPAVNVKVYRSLDDGWTAYKRNDYSDDRFTSEWVDEHMSDDQLQSYWEAACESEFEYLDAWATSDEDSLFPDHNVKLRQEGRSGGWVVVDGLPDLEDWDAIVLARWRKFERIATAIADGIPEETLSLIEINAFEAWSTEQEESARAARQDIATVQA